MGISGLRFAAPAKLWAETRIGQTENTLPRFEEMGSTSALDAHDGARRKLSQLLSLVSNVHHHTVLPWRAVSSLTTKEAVWPSA